jgi:cell division protein FtsB
MKKNSKPAIFIIVLFLTLVTVVLLLAQGLKFKCEELIRERTRLDAEIRSQQTNSVNLVASFQMFTSEDYIKEYAKNELGLIDGDSNQDKKITINKERLMDITVELESKYE